MAERLLCGVDLGGTKLSVGLFTHNGNLIADQKVTDHAHLDNNGMVDRIADLVRGLLESESVPQDRIEAVGIGVAAHINFNQGLIITSSNFIKPFRNYLFRDKLESQLGIPVILDNDANAQAFGEYHFGAGKGKSEVAFITVSTGVGAGIISGGRLLRGYTGFAGEIGHTIIRPDSKIRCTCGNYGCLMALSSTLGMTDRYCEYLKEGLSSDMGYTVENIDTIDGMILEEGVEFGDEISIRIFEESADNIGIGIYNLYQVVNPQAIILGGGLMNMGFGFMDRIRNKFDSLVHNMVQERMEITSAALGNQAGLLGAAALPLESR